MGVASTFSAPEILFVCGESHKVASKVSQIAFHSCWSAPETCFDFSRDTLYLNHDSYDAGFREC